MTEARYRQTDAERFWHGSPSAGFADMRRQSQQWSFTFEHDRSVTQAMRHATYDWCREQFGSNFNSIFGERSHWTICNRGIAFKCPVQAMAFKMRWC